MSKIKTLTLTALAVMSITLPQIAYGSAPFRDKCKSLIVKEIKNYGGKNLASLRLYYKTPEKANAKGERHLNVTGDIERDYGANTARMRSMGQIAVYGLELTCVKNKVGKISLIKANIVYQELAGRTHHYAPPIEIVKTKEGQEAEDRWFRDWCKKNNMKNCF